MSDTQAVIFRRITQVKSLFTERAGDIVRGGADATIRVHVLGDMACRTILGMAGRCILFTAPAGSGTRIHTGITLIIRIITIVLFTDTEVAGGDLRYIALHIAFPIPIITVIIMRRSGVRADIIFVKTRSEYQRLREQTTFIRTIADVAAFNQHDRAFRAAVPTAGKI
jgi:hypothetical protein